MKSNVERELGFIRAELKRLQESRGMVPVAVRVEVAAWMSGLKLTKFKELLRSKEISSFTVDRCRLIRVQELQDWAERRDKHLRTMPRTKGKIEEEKILSALKRR